MQFKKGDRVSVEGYSGASWRPNVEELQSITIYKRNGTIVSECEGGFLVRMDKLHGRDKDLTVATPRMLRRLKPSKPKKRLEFWIEVSPEDTVLDAELYPKKPMYPFSSSRLVRVREVRNGGRDATRARTE